MSEENIRLTLLAKGSGCGCKIAPAVLQQILSNQKIEISENLIVGNHSNDDAAVYDLGNGTALIVTADFFTPVVDDPFDFGMVAAANALSDVYAMGGKPITAIALMGWPIEKVNAIHANKVVEGARKICIEAGIDISGGHTIESPEPFFGLSVNGICNINEIKRNSSAKADDVIILTKAIGTGVLAAASKRNQITPEHYEVLRNQLVILNKVGFALGKFESVHAMTDITGFGLLGHLVEMSEGSGLTAAINFNKIPVLEGAVKYIQAGILPDATYRNWNSFEKKVSIAPEVDPLLSFTLLSDPQTNGGLLIAASESHKDEIISVLNEHHCDGIVIGRFTELKENSVQIEP